MTGILIGTLGSSWRATVTSWGAVVPCDGGGAVDWWVAADDRWHTPSAEPSRRQRRVLGTPVVETSIGVPGGEVAQRAYAVADGGGTLVVEVENRSKLPVAVAFSRPDIASARPRADVPPGAPAGAVTAVPIGHRATVRIVVDAGGAPPGSLPSADQVARGWVAQTETGVRYVVPDAALTERIVTARCDALLASLEADDPITLLLAVAERARLGEPVEPWVDDVAAAAVAVAKRARDDDPSWGAAAALDAAAEVLGRAGEMSAVADVGTMRDRLGSTIGPEPDEAPDGIRAVAWLGRRLVRVTPDGADLVPGFLPAWAGQGVEVYGASVRGASLGFVVRWHGERPALLWETSAPMRLTCSGLDQSWSTTSPRGEALLAPFSRR